MLQRYFNENVAYMAVSIVPLSLLWLSITFGSFMQRVFGDWGTIEFVIALLTMSLVLGLVSVVLVVNAFRQRRYRIGLSVAALAYLPTIIMVFARGK